MRKINCFLLLWFYVYLQRLKTQLFKSSPLAFQTTRFRLISRDFTRWGSALYCSHSLQLFSMKSLTPFVLTEIDPPCDRHIFRASATAPFFCDDISMTPYFSISLHWLRSSILKFEELCVQDSEKNVKEWWK